MEIIKYTPEYKEKVIALERSCFPGDFWEDEIWEDVLSEPDRSIIYLAMEESEPAAFLAVYNWGTERNYVKITNIGTKAAFRGRKIAHKLMEAMLAEMRGLGMETFAGETRVSNFPMQKVFADFGFRVTETMAGYYEKPGEDALRYQLN